MANTTSVWLGGSWADLDAAAPLRTSYEQLVSGANVFEQTGTKVFRMWSTAIDSASSRQVNANMITERQRQENAEILQRISLYCRERGITISVEDNFLWNSLWIKSWTNAAKVAGLPVAYIDGGENIIGVDNTPEALTALAKTFAERAKIAALALPGVKIGDVEPVVAPNQEVRLETLRNWWATYNREADAVGAPRFSYFLADVDWSIPQFEWVPALERALSDAAAAGLTPGLFIVGSTDNLSPEAWVSQAQQRLAHSIANLATQPDIITIQTWSKDIPDSVTPINSAGTMAFLAASVNRLVPFYRERLINAVGPVSISGATQFVPRVGQETSLQGLDLHLQSGDASAGASVAVLLVDQTGVLTALTSGQGHVRGQGTNSLMLVGNASEIRAMLASARITQPVAGPDTLTVVVFGRDGAVASHEIHILALPIGSQSARTTLDFLNVGTSQTWASASATLNENGAIASTTLTWFPAPIDVVTKKFLPTTTMLIHSPFVTDPNLVWLDGRLVSPSAQRAEVFDPMTTQDGGPEFRTVRLRDSVITYDPDTGTTQSIESSIFPFALSTGATNPLSSGGRATTEVNTGSNPNWLSSWDDDLESVVTVRDGQQRIIEEIYKWRVGSVYNQSILTYSPTTQALWQRIDGPPNGTTLDAVRRSVTQYNTGDNPYWDYQSRPTDRSVMTVFQDIRYSQTVVRADFSELRVRWTMRGTDPWTSFNEVYNPDKQKTTESFQWKSDNPLRATLRVFDPASGALYQVWEYPRLGGYTLSQYVLSGSSGDDVILLGTGRYLHLGAGPDFLDGGPGDDRLAGAAGDDRLDGGPGNDTLTGDAGDDFLDGGTGMDTAVFDVAPDNLRFLEEPFGVMTARTGALGNDRLTSIERLQTSDGLVEIGTNRDGLFRISISGENLRALGTAYVGPVAGLQRQFLGGPSPEVLGGTRGSDFINLLGGDDAADAGAGNDVLDGGTGSNFLTGGAGSDVFFSDGRGSYTTWTTITDWQPGEQLSLWGWLPNMSRTLWREIDGTSGFQGVTLHADINADGAIDTSVTWAGKIRADLPTPKEFDGLLWFVL